MIPYLVLGFCCVGCLLLYFRLNKIPKVKRRWYACSRGDHMYQQVSFSPKEEITDGYFLEINNEKCKYCDAQRITETHIKTSKPKRYLQKVI